MVDRVREQHCNAVIIGKVMLMTCRELAFKFQRQRLSTLFDVIIGKVRIMAYTVTEVYKLSMNDVMTL